MERVKEGEVYWYADELLWVREEYETDCYFDRECFKIGNYFHTQEEAESMARKLRAVLNGADVIETPSEEEIKNAQNHIEDEVVFNIRTEGQQLIYCKAINKGAELMADWLKSKIVK